MKLLKRFRLMKLGELKQTGDQCKHIKTWHEIVSSVGTFVSARDVGQFRTRRPLSGFHKR